MKIITNDRNIELTLPYDATENDAHIKGLIQKGLILGLDSETLQGDTPTDIFIRVYLNFIEEDLLAYCISKGYEVNWLRPYNYPYIELDEGTDTGELYVYQTFTNGGKTLIRIYKAGDNQSPLEPTFTELKEWSKLGGIICNPINVAEKLKEYNDEEVI